MHSISGSYFEIIAFRYKSKNFIDKKNSAWGIVSDASGKNENRVYDFNFRDWIIHWVAPEIISFTTKASGRASGSWYLYDLERGDLFNVLKDVKGLTTLASPVGDKALYTYSPNERTIQIPAPKNPVIPANLPNARACVRL